MRHPLHNHDDDLESFLHRQVADHRMYPSDQLWRSIQKELHGEGKWPALTYISILIIAALAFCTIMVKPEERLQKNTMVYPAVKEEPVAALLLNSGHSKEPVTHVQYTYSDRMTQQTMESVSEAIIARTEKENLQQPANLVKESLITIVDTKTNNVPANTTEATGKTMLANRQPEPMQNTDETTVAATAQENKPVTLPAIQFATNKPASRYFSTIGLMSLSDLKKPASVQPSTTLYDKEEMWRNYPLTNANDLWRKKLSKFSFQFYITPSVSYRRLNDANGKVAHAYTALPRSTNYQLDINRIVAHQAQMGAEVGFALGYKLTNTLTAKGGFQFNVRQYGIKAYTVPMSQPSPDAAIDNNLPGNTTGNPDEAVTQNSYLTSANDDMVSKPVVLNNRYYELSVPVGLDWRILSSGNGKFTVNTAVSLQPTYTFDKEPFVITTDYKSYTEGASIMRNWNLNSNVEAYVTYKMGAFRWQLGPQFRYQHFSTYSNTYPIREHLLDYGLKIGFTKSID